MVLGKFGEGATVTPRATLLHLTVQFGLKYAGVERNEDVHGLARQINDVRIATFHPRLRNRPGRILEINRGPCRLDQFALSYQRQQNHAQRQANGRIRGHRFHLPVHQAQLHR